MFYLKCAGHFYAFPAHHKPLQSSKRLRTMRRRSFCRLARLFGGGDWECQSLICRYVPKNAANLHKKLQIRSLKKQKSHKME